MKLTYIKVILTTDATYPDIIYINNWVKHRVNVWNIWHVSRKQILQNEALNLGSNDMWRNHLFANHHHSTGYPPQHVGSIIHLLYRLLHL